MLILHGRPEVGKRLLRLFVTSVDSSGTCFCSAVDEGEAIFPIADFQRNPFFSTTAATFDFSGMTSSFPPSAFLLRDIWVITCEEELVAGLVPLKP